MATSDAPLNVPNVTLAVARGASTPPSNLPASFQLSVGNYAERNVDPLLIYPRPDSETAAWTKHRRHYPGIGYRVPIGVAFGSGPLVYELIDGPAGAAIGEFLVVSGDTLIPNEDYGVLTWANPTMGNHSFHVRVSFQDGFAPIDVQWTLEVTTTSTIFIDAVNGSDTTGDGSISNPFQTANAWWKNDMSDLTYSEFQVCYRAGTHNIAVDNSLTGENDGDWVLKGTDKPLVHYPYTGENVVFDVTNTTIVFGFGAGAGGGVGGSDCYFGKFEYNGIKNIDNPRIFAIYGTSSPEVYAAGGEDQRMTWDSPSYVDFINTTTAANNSGCIWANNPGTDRRRHFFYIHRPTFTNCLYFGPNAESRNHVNFNGYYLGNVKGLLTDHVTCVNTGFGRAPIAPKAGADLWCIRWVDLTQAPKQPYMLGPSGSYMPGHAGPMELSYAKVGVEEEIVDDSATIINYLASEFTPADDDHPVYISRSTLSRAPTNLTAIKIRNFWPLELDGVLVVSNDPGAPVGSDHISYSVVNNPLDTSLNLTGSERTTHLGRYGAEIKAE